VVRQLLESGPHILALYCCEVLRGSAAALHTTAQYVQRRSGESQPVRTQRTQARVGVESCWQSGRLRVALMNAAGE
jgi:hypothetical protein